MNLGSDHKLLPDFFAQDPSLVAHQWHESYSLRRTQVLGRLVCIVVSKILGTGSAERNFKEVKRVHSASQNRLTPVKTGKLTTIVGSHCGEKAERRRVRVNKAGTLWSDEDFGSLKLDNRGVEVDVVSNGLIPKRVFCAWRESWEVDPPKMDAIYMKRLTRKYGGLQ